MSEFNLEIVEKQNDVTYDIPQVNFPAYEEYKEKAYAVAEYIYNMEPTEENIKETKATLAKARKLTDKLNRARIDMKKAILQNYTTFEQQVKEITGIIDDADKEIRAKVKDMEEAEREKKKAAIHELWLKRIPAYDYDLLNAVLPNAFDRWLTPKHLNKSTSMKSIEADMTAWIQKTLTDIETAKSMGDDYVEAYAWTVDLAKAIAEVHRREDALDAIHGLMDPDEEEPSQTFVVYGWDNISKAEDLLRRNDIKFITY
jgi:hypothetical protein